MVDLISKKAFVDSTISLHTSAAPELTEGQKACLRLVAQHHTSKEIARKLGISPFTVDQRLDAARRKLNTTSRKEAAKIFAAFEEDSISQSLVYEPSALASASISDSKNIFGNRARRSDAKRFARMFSALSFPPTEGERHELSSREILFHALNIAFFSSLVMAFVVVVLTSAFKLVK